jgi:L-amino acid N-acyltransferase
MVGAIEAASLALHQRCGFTTCCTIRGVGHKFDRWLDVEFVPLLLRL